MATAPRPITPPSVRDIGRFPSVGTTSMRCYEVKRCSDAQRHQTVGGTPEKGLRRTGKALVGDRDVFQSGDAAHRARPKVIAIYSISTYGVPVVMLIPQIRCKGHTKYSTPELHGGGRLLREKDTANTANRQLTASFAVKHRRL